MSPLVRWILDLTAPPIRLNAPKDGAVINRNAVLLEGRTQGRTTLKARNQATGDSVAGTAAADGTFALSLPITTGPNQLKIIATDPAFADALDRAMIRYLGFLGAERIDAKAVKAREFSNT